MNGERNKGGVRRGLGEAEAEKKRSRFPKTLPSVPSKASGRGGCGEKRSALLARTRRRAPNCVIRPREEKRNEGKKLL